MPTIGQLKCFLAGFDFGFALARFDRGDLVLLVFVRERDALLFDLRFAAMRFHFNSLSRVIQAAIQ